MIEKDYSRKISERLWNVADKGELESQREATFIDDIIQKSHIEKELLANIKGIETVFDGGAGCGRFSILLAKMGCKVTHFDISQPMLDKARELAGEAGVEKNITFVKGALEDLSAYQDKSFDLVMSFDAPISYTYPNQEKVISELVRIANRQKAIDNFSFNKEKFNEILQNGMLGGEAEIAQYEKGGTPWCITYTFMPDELKSLLEIGIILWRTIWRIQL